MIGMNTYTFRPKIIISPQRNSEQFLAIEMDQKCVILRRSVHLTSFGMPAWRGVTFPLYTTDLCGLP